MKFIIVDDEEVNLFITKRLLFELLGEKEVKTFLRASEALSYLKEYDECVTISLFLDLNMPVISGWDFLDYFDELDSTLKSLVHIYIVSSSVDPDERTKALNNPNVSSFISKPLTAASIREHFGFLSTKDVQQ